MADMMDTLKELLGDNADEKISSVLNMLSSSGNNDNSVAAENKSDSSTSLPGSLSPEMLMQAYSIMQQISESENDDRSNLLISLKPYMRESRKKLIDDTVKFLNIAKISKLFQGGI